jgi:putative ABC transport system substrate-binding protein
MRRREFITLLAGAATAWPLAVRGQQAVGVRRIGVLMNTTADSSDQQAQVAVFSKALQELGWTEGRNVRIDIRWAAAGDPREINKHVADLAASAPDVIFATGTASMGPFLQATRTIPIVFARAATSPGFYSSSTP